MNPSSLNVVLKGIKYRLEEKIVKSSRHDLSMLSLGRNAVLFQSGQFSVQNKSCDGAERYEATDAALYKDILKVGRPCLQMNTNSKDDCNITCHSIVPCPSFKFSFV